jgi:hypothetical protein
MFPAGAVTAQAPELEWVKVADKAAWAPRDSCGEFALRGRMWLVGGWHGSFEDPPRDVWSSDDGVAWKLESKAIDFKHTDLTTSITFKDRAWLFGGWHGGRLPHASATNEVWSSADGVSWRRVTKDAGWEPRLGAAAVVFKGRLWVLGGCRKYYFGTDDDLRNDVWSSADGVTWERATAKAAWPARAYHAAAVLGDRMYVFGGGNYQPKYAARNDVWSSADGVTWTQKTDAAPWPPRLWFSSAVYRDRMWVLGGWSNNPSKNWNDVWTSADGKTWTELKARNVWPVRHEHSTYVFRDQLWVTGGMSPPLKNDTWRLHVPEGYFDKK